MAETSLCMNVCIYIMHMHILIQIIYAVDVSGSREPSINNAYGF